MTGAANASVRDRAPAEDEAGLQAALFSGSAVERRDAALALVDVAEAGFAPATVEALADRARTDDEADVRQFAVEALGVAGAGLDAVEDALDDPVAWVRAEAVVALSRAGAGYLDALRRCLDDEDGWVRRNALIALGKTGALEAPELRTRLKEDPHGPVREYAAGYLAESPGHVAEAETVLAAVLARDPDAFVRARAAQSLGELGTERAIEALETQGLGDRSDDVRRTAKRALATARGKVGVDGGGEPDRVGAAGGRGTPGRGCSPTGLSGAPGEVGPDES